MKKLIFVLIIVFLSSGCLDTTYIHEEEKEWTKYDTLVELDSHPEKYRMGDVMGVRFLITGINKLDNSPLTIYIVGDDFIPLKDFLPETYTYHWLRTFKPISDTSKVDYFKWCTWGEYFPWITRNLGNHGFQFKYHELPATGDYPAYQIFDATETYNASVDAGTPYMTLYIPEMQRIVRPNVSDFFKISEKFGRAAFVAYLLDEEIVNNVNRYMLYEDSEIVLYIWIQV